MWRKIIDELFSRYVFVVDLLIIIVFAAFAAAAVDETISGRIDTAISGLMTPGSEPAAAKSSGYPGKGASAAPSGFRPADGKAILSRNFFDSVTGPLDETEYDLGDFTAQEEVYAEKASDMSSLPPKCSTSLRVVGLFAADDPEWAFAAVSESEETKILCLGDTIQNFKVTDITWKYLFLGQTGSSGSCYLDIWGDELAGAAASMKGKPGMISAKAAGQDSGKNPAEVRKNFHKLLSSSISDVSATEKNIDKGLVDYLVENKHMLMKSGRILPNIENEEINGFKVYGIRKTSLWGKLGIQNGDIVHSVNGITFTGPEAAMEAFGKLQGSDHLTVHVTRRGNPMNLDLNIK